MRRLLSSPIFLTAATLFAVAVGLLWVGRTPVTAAADTPPQTVVIEGHRDAADASVSTKAMRYLAFDVPEGVTQITVHREYTNGPDLTAGKNTVDFGLFDNRGTERGFRGWQGGSPGDFVLTGDPATCSPHAIPGPLPTGRWAIAQYYLASVPSGLGYKYTVTFAFDGAKPPAPFPAPPRYAPGIVRPGAHWYAGNLHAHSLHSDGGRTFTDLIGHCEEAGFDFVASTEHNSPTAHFHFADAASAHPKVLLLYGDEFTSPSGHANIIGQTPGYWFDFRLDGGDGRLPGVIADAHQQGALFVVNHPFALCTSCFWRYPLSEWQTADAIEVWNGKWSPEDRAAVDLWDRNLKAGRHFRAFGGTDYHRGSDALCPAALVYADNLSMPAIMDGLRRGHVVLSESPKGPRVLLTIPMDRTKMPGDTIAVAPGAEGIDVEARVVGGGEGLTLRLIWANGETRLPVPRGGDTMLRFRVPVSGANPYVRAELLRTGDVDGAEKMVSLTNPLYFTRMAKTAYERQVAQMPEN